MSRFSGKRQKAKPTDFFCENGFTAAQIAQTARQTAASKVQLAAVDTKDNMDGLRYYHYLFPAIR